MENCFDWFTGSSEWQLRLVVEHRVLPSPDAPAYARKKGSREALLRRSTGPLRVPIARNSRAYTNRYSSIFVDRNVYSNARTDDSVNLLSVHSTPGSSPKVRRPRQVRASIWIEALSIGIIGFMQRIVSGAIIRCHKLEIVARDFQGIPLAYCIPAGIEQPCSPLSGTTDNAI